MNSKNIYNCPAGQQSNLYPCFFLLTNKQEKKNVSQVSFFSREGAEEYNRTSLKQGIEQGLRTLAQCLRFSFE